MRNEIVIYQDLDNSISLEVLVENETLWLTQQQIVELFQSSKANISEHIKNIFKTKELEENSTVRKIRTVQNEGNRRVSRDITYYNLDVVISIGYRVNSIRGTQFRIWANRVLKEYLLRGYVVNQRMEKLENQMATIERKVHDIEVKINTELPPRQGIFFDGQVFDAHVFVSGIIKSAKRSIILIDNYIDESVLLLLSKRSIDVDVIIYTKTISQQFDLDLNRYNQQYPPIKVKTFTRSHDRFLIIDYKVVYHLGASLKDLGKKWFAFSRLEIDADILLSNLE